MKVLLVNCLTRPQVFTTTDKETFRITARGTEGSKKEIEKDKISQEIEKAIKIGNLALVDVEHKKLIGKPKIKVKEE